MTAHWGMMKIGVILKPLGCPLGCNCLLFAMECNNTAYKTIQTSYPYISMSIHQIYIPILNTVLEHFPKVIQLKLTRNNITDVCKSILPKSLVIVDLRFNALKSLCKDCFKCLKDLKIIFLDNNNISLIESLSFNNLINLKIISLSSNPITNFPRSLFAYFTSLKMLSIRRISFSEIEPNTFYDLNIEFIDTSDYHICCITLSILSVMPLNPWYISCTNLLPDHKMRIFFILISTCIMIVNSISIFFTWSLSEPLSAITISINITDMLCGIYLSIIWIKDFTFEGTFSIKEEIWRTGVTCFTAFGIILLFTILSQLVLLFLSLSRLIFVIQPINNVFQKNKICNKSTYLHECTFRCAVIFHYFYC